MVETSLASQIVNAIKTGDVEKICSIFIENPSQNEFYTPFAGETWLGYAAGIGSLKSTKELIKLGSNVNLGDKRDNVRPICSAAARGHYEIVEYLLEQGSELDVSASIRNPLFAAIVGRSPKIVTLLLEAGIDSAVHYNSDTMSDMDAAAFALMQGERECAEIIALWNAKGDDAISREALEHADKIAEENAYRKLR